MINSGVTASLDRFIVQNGFVLDYGGGIYSDGNLSITNSSIHNNSIGNYCYGGGVFFNGDVLSIENTTVGNNSAGCNGGGVFSSSPSSTVTINNSTISNNNGGGVYNNGTFNLKNTIISGNTVEDCNGVPFTSQGNNIIGSTAGCNISASSGDQFDVDPLLGAFDPAQGIYPLLPSSPAIDAGNPATCLATDQRGVTRPQGARCDIGAFELEADGGGGGEVTIDIKPGSQSNPINPRSIGKIPVAILSTADFNAPSEVDKTSLTFGRTGDEVSLAFCNKKGEDVNSDGLLDLVCQFKTKLTGFKFGDAEGFLKGQTLEGVPIAGRDSVKVMR
jgi:hypothetical protein